MGSSPVEKVENLLLHVTARQQISPFFLLALAGEEPGEMQHFAQQRLWLFLEFIQQKFLSAHAANVTQRMFKRQFLLGPKVIALHRYVVGERSKTTRDPCFEARFSDYIRQMDRPAATVPEPVYRLAEGVLFQQLDRESVLLNMKTEQYFGLDPVGTRIWQLLTTKHSVEATVTTMRSEYEVDEAKLRHDVLALADRLTAKGLLVAEPGPTDAPRA